ncbi:MAG: flagellar hook-associated protein 3 [Elusimicrobia bacterium RIFOXYB2_FULL_49_7]|nr:MAG: flagellar hook-associated protein 3 [Elusimicrobia bacterium RIFOXYB2_FULL_49_7]
MMRVTFTQINDTVMRNINYNAAKLSQLQEQLSSGRRLNRPSDNPIDMKNNINYKAELAQDGQFKRNIDDGAAWMAMTEVAMTDMNTLIQDIRERALQAASDTMTANEREYTAQEIQQLLQQLVSLSNSNYKGNYLFGGTNADKPVYEYTEDTQCTFAPNTLNVNTFQSGVWNAMRTYEDNKLYQYKRLDPNSVHLTYTTTAGGIQTTAVEGVDFEVNYSEGTIRTIAGSAFETALNDPLDSETVDITFNHYNKTNRENTGSIYREIEQGVKVRINTSADEVFEDNTSNLDMIGAMTNLLDALYKNSGARVSEAITDIDGVAKVLLAAQSRNGARINRFDLTGDRNGNREVEISRLQSELEDLDFADAIMKFSMSQNVYNASLQAGAKVILPTLGNYI